MPFTQWLGRYRVIRRLSRLKDTFIWRLSGGIKMRRQFSNILIVLFSLFLVIPQGLTTAQNSSGTSGARQTSRLSKHSRELLASARVNNKRSVSLLIGAQPGADQVVAGSINSLGGTIRYREDVARCLLADIPIDKVDAVAGLPGVQTADLDE